MDRNCTKCKYPWIPDESDIKKDGTYCRMCRKCREKASKYFEKTPTFSIKIFYAIVVVLITNFIIKDI